MNPIKVLLVIEVRLIANLFASVLEDEPGMAIAGVVSTVEDATEFLQRQSVDVALVSADLPDHQALKFTQSTMECSPSTKVVVLGLSEENQHDTLRYIEAGAAGYILKDSSLKELIDVIRLAQKGEAQVSTRMAGAMMERLFRLARVFSAVENKIDSDVRLTSRELEVLQFISEGLTNQEIASRLVVEVGTVKNHVHRILEKLNVSSRQEAASYLAFIKK
ncbi:MAG TPA: response regulator transcription factor [Anaerolineales bacterium]|nr:response regulator transcription factor [Anaerolineales bacterium]